MSVSGSLENRGIKSLFSTHMTGSMVRKLISLRKTELSIFLIFCLVRAGVQTGAANSSACLTNKQNISLSIEFGVMFSSAMQSSVMLSSVMLSCLMLSSFKLI